MFAQLLRDFGLIRVAEMAREGAMQGLIAALPNANESWNVL